MNKKYVVQLMAKERRMRRETSCDCPSAITGLLVTLMVTFGYKLPPIVLGIVTSLC